MPSEILYYLTVILRSRKVCFWHHQTFVILEVSDYAEKFSSVSSGMSVSWSAYAMARLPQVWGPDAEQLKPERWMEKSYSPFEASFPIDTSIFVDC